MVKIACYSDCIYKNYPHKWPDYFPVKPELGDKIMSKDGESIGIIIDIIYKQDFDGNSYAHIELAMEK